MGLLIDTDVWVVAEKSGSRLNLARWGKHGGAYMSAVTVSSLLKFARFPVHGMRDDALIEMMSFC